MIADLGKSISNSLSNLFKSSIDSNTLSNVVKDVCTSLLKANVNPKYVMEIRSKILSLDLSNQVHANKVKLVQKQVFNCLLDLLDPKTQKYKIKKNSNNVIIFVGLQGAGKTTNICKYAGYYKRKGFKVGIVCADTFRAGAFDQLKQNCEILKVPYYGSSNPDPVLVAKEGVSKFKKSDFDLILVDTSGRNTQEKALFDEMKNLCDSIKPDNIVFVMDAGIGQSAEEQAKGFRDVVGYGGVLLTKVDGAERAGGSISAVASSKVPIEFIGVGEGLQDIDEFDANRFVSKMLGYGDVTGLMNAFSSIDIDEKELAEKMVQGEFKLRDFKKIYSQIMSLGPISKLIEMIPGFQNVPIPNEAKFKRMMHIFDSLSKSELDSDGTVFNKSPSRIYRIAKGSGTSISEVTEAITGLKQMNSLMKKMRNMPGFKDMLSGKSMPASMSGMFGKPEMPDID